MIPQTLCAVDKAQDVARAYKVTAMPTFAYVKNERKVHEVKGANAGACVFPACAVLLTISVNAS
jgi:hypothetical protein